jgi:hypothetical protein
MGTDMTPNQDEHARPEHAGPEQDRPEQDRPEQDRPKPDMRATAMAAFAIAESLALALAERGILDQKEVEGLLHDAAAAHSNTSRGGAEGAAHAEAARLIGRVISGMRCVDRQP